MTSTNASSLSNTLRPILPARGSAIVKSVSSGDTVILLGRPTSPNGKAPEVTFTFERVSSPRIASKGNNNTDEPGAFTAREWLRNLVIGKSVMFDTRKQGATAGDRVYGILSLPNPDQPTELWNLGVESVRRGLATPKIYEINSGSAPSGDASGSTNVNGTLDSSTAGTNVEDALGVEYDRQLQMAYQQAKADGVGIHSTTTSPLVRNIKNAVDDYNVTDLVRIAMAKKQTVRVVLEYIFDASRYRCHITDDNAIYSPYRYSNLTIILAGVNAPRVGNPRADPPVVAEPFADVARAFVEQRLLQREVSLTLHGTDKTGSCIVATVHHPKGSIAVELLKRGYAKMSDWSARMMDSLDLPALRIAENSAKVSSTTLYYYYAYYIFCFSYFKLTLSRAIPPPKNMVHYVTSLQRTNAGVWQSYKPPELTTASSLNGTIIEVLTGDTVSILPNGVDYDDESKLVKISLASVRAPRIGNEKLGKADEPYAAECKDRLRLLTVGKSAKVEVHYERDIPLPNGISEKRAFATISVGKKHDIGEVLVSEGLATTQRHRDEEEKSPNYDALCLAEAAAKEAKKNIHNTSTEYKKSMTNDLTDPKKAKAYSGSLIRAGNLKATVEYVFNGSRFKLFIPSENCHIAFACEYLRCPQPTPLVGALGQQQQKAAEPFGDAAKRFARLTVHQRAVEINARNVTLGGVITGQLFFGQGAQRKDYTIEIVGAGLATLDEKKLEYGEVPKVLMDAQTAAQKNKVGLWSVEPKEDSTKKVIKSKHAERAVPVCLSEIRNGSHIYFTNVGDDSASVIAESMKLFTSTHGTRGGPCDVKVGKVVAALFDDGNGSSWYRAKILGRKDKSRVSVLFIDHGNVATVQVSTHLRPLDVELGPNRIPAVAKEAVLALIHVRELDDDDGLNAARMLQSRAWGKNLTAVIHCEVDGRAILSLYGSEEAYGQSDAAKSINEELVAAGYARVAKKSEVDLVASAVTDGQNVRLLAERLAAAQEDARKARAGMWRYGDIGDEDEEE